MVILGELFVPKETLDKEIPSLFFV